MSEKGSIHMFRVSIALVGLLALFLFSCSPVKFVPENQYLLNKVEVNVDNPKISKEEAKSYIRQKENYRILGFAKFHLLLYNLSSKSKTDDWLKRIGEPPQIYDQAMTERSETQLKQFLNNKGYFQAQIDTSLIFKEKKQKVNLTFDIKTGEQYKISSIKYHIKDSALRTLFYKDSLKNYIHSGTSFDYYLLDKQRANIVNLFRRNGYYYFTKDDISYLADSSSYAREIKLDLFIGNSRENRADSSKVFSPYYLNNFYISVLPGNTPVASARANEALSHDTIQWDNVTVYRNPQIKYRTNLFMRSLKMESGALYNIRNVEKTFTAFNRLRQFRFIDIKFDEPKFAKDTNLLDSYIRLAPLSKQSTSFDIEGTNTSGNLGVAGNINYQHRNVFHGAEVFQIRLRGAIERQQRVVNEMAEYFNTREFGIESSLDFPTLLGPGKFINAFEEFLPKTVLSLGYNFQRRPEYTRTILNFKFGYDWMTSERARHTWNLMDFNMVNLYQFDPDFIDLIKDLYIKSSFTDHLIMALNYSFIYNTQNLGVSQNYTYIRFNVESAGNLLHLLSSVSNQTKVYPVDSLGLGESSYYRLFGTRYAQYLKSDVEFRYGYTLDKYNTIVTRAFLGVGFPYGNFDVLPFEKKYFTGGANGIRAWQVRSLGPGTYKAPSGAYPNQSSDIKIEANLEYRFKLLSFLEGALFMDVGNIWAINKKDNREGAQFAFDRFYRQFAFGTGTGFRFDFSYFIFRLDLGMKLREPESKFGDGWIIGNRSYKTDDFTFSFAIGYPF